MELRSASDLERENEHLKVFVRRAEAKVEAQQQRSDRAVGTAEDLAAARKVEVDRLTARVKHLEALGNPNINKQLEVLQHRNQELEAQARQHAVEKQKLVKRAEESEEAVKVLQAEARAYKVTIKEYAKAMHQLQKDVRVRDEMPPVPRSIEPYAPERARRAEPWDTMEGRNPPAATPASSDWTSARREYRSRSASPASPHRSSPKRSPSRSSRASPVLLIVASASSPLASLAISRSFSQPGPSAGSGSQGSNSDLSLTLSS
jgi:hypothetical protein